MPFMVMLCHLDQHHMTPIASSMAHDTDASTGGTEGHMIPLNNHPNMTEAIVSLMVPPASCDRKHIIAMLMQKLICPTNAIYKLNMLISLSA